MTNTGNIGSFKVIRQLGHGSFATVTLARDEDLDALVAVKVLAENWAADTQVRQRFIEEARLLRRIDHERVIRVYSVGSLEDGRPYFVMEYANGGTLADRLIQHPARRMTVNDALRVSRELARSLKVIHDADIIHRDVKPSNVLFRERPSHHTGSSSEDDPETHERVVLGDLGVARLSATGASTVPAGTPRYMAPEQHDGKSTPCSDLYSAGLVLVESLTGTLPPTSVLHSGSVGTWAASLTEMPSEVSDLIDRAVATDPKDRFRDASEWEVALSEIGSVDTRPAQPGHQIVGRKGARRSGLRTRVNIGLVVVLAILITGVGSAILMRSDPLGSNRGSGQGLKVLTGVLWEAQLPLGVSHDVRIFATSDDVFAGAGGTLYSLDLRNGEPDWEHPTLFPLVAPVAETSGIVVAEMQTLFGSAADVTTAILGLDLATGVTRWRYEPCCPEALTAVTVDGIVAVAHRPGPIVQGLDPVNGEAVWTYETDQSEVPINDVIELHAMGQSLLILGGTESRIAVHAVDASSGRPQWVLSIDAGEVRSMQADRSSVYLLVTSPQAKPPSGERPDTLNAFALEAASGEQRWAVDGEPFGDWYFNSLIVGSGVVVAPNAAGDAVLAFSSETGEGLWTAPAGEPLAAIDGIVYLGGASLVALDAATGDQLWTYDEEDHYYRHLVTSGDVILVSGVAFRGSVGFVMALGSS